MDNDIILDELNLNDFKILISLIDKNDSTVGKSKLKGKTIAELAEQTKFSKVKVGQVIKNFSELGFIEEGLKKGRAKTYFLTYEGLSKINEFKNEIIG